MRKMSSFKHAQAGVTLIELMVGLTIGLIITGGAMTILFANQKMLINKEVSDRTQEGFRFATATITRLVRQASSFDKPSSNNELVINFNSTQRDCLGKVNNSTTNTLKVDSSNQLVCILDKDSTRTYVLAKDIGELQFSYGIQQSGAVIYSSYYSSGTTVATNVNSVWNNITSVLTRINLIQQGNPKQPMLDFIATSHQRSNTGSLSSGGTSTIGSGSGGVTTTPITIIPLPAVVQPSPISNESNISQGTIPDSSVSGVTSHILALLSVDYFAANASTATHTTWVTLANSTFPTVVTKGENIQITLSATKYDLSKWSLVLVEKKNNSTTTIKTQALPSNNSSATITYTFSTPDGNGKDIEMYLIENKYINSTPSNITQSTIKFVTSN